jgi:hypothetical protein
VKVEVLQPSSSDGFRMTSGGEAGEAKGKKKLDFEYNKLRVRGQLVFLTWFVS